MKGVVFNLLQDSVSREYGEATWDGLLEQAGLEGAYTALGTYPDADVVKLVDVASSALGVPPEDVLRWFGKSAIAQLAKAYPTFFEGHDDTCSFLLTLNDIIHPEVRKLYPGADVPVFDFSTTPVGALVIGYKSSRKLCSFAEGLIAGAAEHYADSVEIDQSRCMLKGDDKCVIVCSFKARD